MMKNDENEAYCINGYSEQYLLGADTIPYFMRRKQYL